MLNPKTARKLLGVTVTAGLIVAAALVWRLNLFQDTFPAAASPSFTPSDSPASGFPASSPPDSQPPDLSYRNPTLSVEERLKDLLGRMTLQEKIAQMVQAEMNTVNVEEMKQYGLGSILGAGGSSPSTNEPSAWMDMTDGFQKAALETRLAIPFLFGIDAVHGHNNVVGATLFPHNIGLGATRDAGLVRRIGEATALEMRATGIPWNFAPCLCVPRDERWGRTYEGYGETPELVAELGAALVTGLQGEAGSADWLGPRKAIATLKHWVGDGAASFGRDRGDALIDEQEMRRYIEPYRKGIQAGARSVMVSFSSWNGERMHGSRRMVTDVLKNELGFTGIVVSDFNGIEVMEPDFKEAVKRGVNAGIDVFMEPDNWKKFVVTLEELVKQGAVPAGRIDDAVTRILRVKFEAGLFEHPFGDRTLPSSGIVGSSAHRALAREAVGKSAVLLQNEAGILPLNREIRRLVVAGSLADDIGGQSGGWSITWQGQLGPATPGTTIVQGIRETVSSETNVVYSPDGAGVKEADAVIAVIGETPYAEGSGDRLDLSLSLKDRDLLESLSKSGVPVIVVLLSGRPLILTEELKLADAFVAAWLPGTEGGGVADVLFGIRPFTGRLPVTWPSSMEQIPVNADAPIRGKPLFPFGFGLDATR